ncbi:MAG: PQQ-binding-like beta-propeller repeat protein [Bryobacteraceae bacterium]
MRLLLLAVLLAAVCPASDWTRFRGPNGTGLSSDRSLPAELGKDRNLVWKTATPKGNSSPIVIRDRVFFTGHEGDERLLLCYDTKSGALVWKRGLTKARTETAHPLNGPATPTPASDGQSVFAFFPDFGLVAYDFDGKERWRTPLGPFAAIQGMAASPVYAEGNVILLVDTPESATLAAFHARNGKRAWTTERPIGFLGSYTTPAIYKPSSGPVQLIVAGAVELTGYQAKTGERLWWARGITNGPAAPPLVAGDSVYTVEPSGDGAPPYSQMLTSYDKNKNGVVDLDELAGETVNLRIMQRLFGSIDRNTGNGDGKVTAEEWKRAFNNDPPGGGLVRTRIGKSGDVSRTNLAWRHTKGLPYVTAALLYEGVLYVVRDGGILSTFDPESGKVLREERLKDGLGDYYASPIAGDGKVYFASKDGRLSVIQAGADWKMLSSANLDEQVIATPAIAGGRIYVRTESHLYCFGLKSN